MGPKITIDSSTLMNKGLEVIEAHELFGTPYDQIEVVVHPQSVVHSMVEFTDGCTIAQLSMPDMRLPIGYALAYPGAHRHAVRAHRLVARCGRLDFEPPDTATFRCLALAYEAGRVGGTAPAWLSAANEVAVEAFLAGRLRWPQIAEVCDAALQRYEPGADATVDDIIAADAARACSGHRRCSQREQTRYDQDSQTAVMAGRSPSGPRPSRPTGGHRPCIGHRRVARAVRGARSS